MRIEEALDKADREDVPKSSEESPKTPKLIQWNYRDGVYTPMPSLNIKKKMVPGYYVPFKDMNGGLHFQGVDVRLDGLVDFGKGVSKKITDQIELFWQAEPKFRQINKTIKVLYKRGILMYGPPGCGKSSLISVIMRDVIKQDGVALYFINSGVTTEAVKVIRDIQPDTKILIVLEDIDGYVQHGEEDLLNLLDGVDTVMDRVIFLATSNHFQRLSSRLLRPSRFDLKIELTYPDADLRKRYLQDLLKANGDGISINLAQSVADSEGFSFADLKELFISTCIFGYNYKTSVADLRNSLHTEENLRNSLHTEENPGSGMIDIGEHLQKLSTMVGKRVPTMGISRKPKR